MTSVKVFHSGIITTDNVYLFFSFINTEDLKIGEF